MKIMQTKLNNNFFVQIFCELDLSSLNNNPKRNNEGSDKKVPNKIM